MNSTTMLIILALVLAVGYFAGLLVSSLFGNRSKLESKTARPGQNEGQLIQPGQPQASAGSAITASMPAATQNVARFDQILFWRDRPGGPLQITIDGDNLSQPGTLTVGQRQRLTAMLLEIRPWLKEAVSKPPEGTNNENTGPANNLPEPEKVVVSRRIPQEITPNPSSPQAQKSIATQISEILQPPLPQAPKSIVVQIDEILQSQISGTALAGRGIRLSEAPGQGVIVWIGLEQFAGIDMVKDAGVLAAIRRAVSTWEANS